MHSERELQEQLDYVLDLMDEQSYETREKGLKLSSTLKEKRIENIWKKREGDEEWNDMCDEVDYELWKSGQLSIATSEERRHYVKASLKKSYSDSE